MGGRSAIEDETLDFLRTRSGFLIGEVGDLMVEVSWRGDGVRVGSEMPSSFSNMLGVLVLRMRAGCVGLIPYFSGRCVYWLGLRHDSNSASSRGVTARREKPRILLLERFQQKSPRTTARARTRVPRTAARMIQILGSMVIVPEGGDLDEREGSVGDLLYLLEPDGEVNVTRAR